MSLHTDRFAEELVRHVSDDGAGETVVFKSNVVTAGRSIQALVKRDVALPLPDGSGLAPSTIVVVCNDSTLGITPTEIGAATTKTLAIANRLGESATDRPIRRIISHNASFMELEVR